MSDDWDDIAEWWVAATSDGPADSDEMLDVVRALIEPTSGRTLDLGCGEGQALPLLGDGAIGVDLSHRLLTARARTCPGGPVPVARPVVGAPGLDRPGGRRSACSI